MSLSISIYLGIFLLSLYLLFSIMILKEELKNNWTGKDVFYVIEHLIVIIMSIMLFLNSSYILFKAISYLTTGHN